VAAPLVRACLTEPVVMGALEASLVGGAAIAETGGQASRRAAHRWGRKHSFEGAARKEEEEEAGLQERHGCQDRQQPQLQAGGQTQKASLHFTSMHEAFCCNSSEDPTPSQEQGHI
jgi:hypothetical protein